VTEAKTLAGRVAIVTGGNRGIGLAIARLLAEDGASVVVSGRDAARLDAAVKELESLGAPALGVPADATKREDADRLVEVTRERFGRIDVLVNNVGGSLPALFRDMPREQYLHEVNLNLLAPIVTTRTALDTLVPQGSGCVVSLASAAAWGEPRTAVYGAAKAGIVALTRSLAKEHGRHGLRFNAVAPGAVEPEGIGSGSLWATAGQIWQDDSQLASVLRQVPLRRLSTPDDIAYAVLFLASETTARQLTGQVLNVSGGFHMST